MSHLSTYIFFNGTCAEAIRYYELTLGGKIETLMTQADTPDAEKMPPSMAQKIVHARLNIDGVALMASDWMSSEPYPGMHGYSLSLAYPTADQAKRIFAALAEGGAVHMPFQETFWAEGFGMLADKFGTPWMINGAMRQP
jgi:PhnB protein